MLTYPELLKKFEACHEKKDFEKEQCMRAAHIDHTQALLLQTAKFIDECREKNNVDDNKQCLMFSRDATVKIVEKIDTIIQEEITNSSKTKIQSSLV